MTIDDPEERHTKEIPRNADAPSTAPGSPALPRASKLITVVANLLPLAGVIWLGWKPFDYIALYWLESWIFFVFVLAQVRARFIYEKQPGYALVLLLGYSAGYLIVMAMLGFAIFDFLPHFASSNSPVTPSSGSLRGLVFGKVVGLLKSEPWLIVALAVLTAGHVASYVRDFIVKRDVVGLTVPVVLESLVQRIFILFVAVVVGGAVWRIGIGLGFPGSMLAVTAVLVALKTALEIGLVTWPVEKDQIS